MGIFDDFYRKRNRDFRELQIGREESHVRLRLSRDWDKSATEKLRILNSMYNGSSVRREAINRVKKGYLKSALEEHILSEG